MSVATVKAPVVGAQSGVGIWRIAQSAAVVSVGLYTIAFLVRISAVGVSFPLSEGSAYYAAVARSLASGRGLLIDAIWSYSTPPLTLPRPAFELWQPMASFVAAVPMALFGSTFGVAQFAGLLLGSLLAPITWLVARDTARRIGLPERRAWFASVGAGVLAAVTGPFVLSTVVPDSSLTFTVLAVGACLLMPAAAAGERRALIGLGLLLGLTYLTRFEAIWLGLTFAGLAVVVARPARSNRWRIAFPRIAAVAAIAAVVAVPWWLRNLSVFGSPFPGQMADNAFLTRNEQIYAYADRPSLDGFLGQGIPVMLANVAAAFWHNIVDVLLVPAAPVVAVGVLALVAAVWHRRQLPRDVRFGTLAVLLISGALTLVATSVLFPVATLWGTFEHASGPLLVGLLVAAVFGGDAFVAWLVRRRDWERQNGWMAPAALVALTVPLALFQMSSAIRDAGVDQRTMIGLAGQVPAALNAAGVDPSAPIITDRPIWVSDALGRSTLALSDEPVETVLAVARRFGAGSVVVVEGRGDYPAALANGQSSCFQPLNLGNSSTTGKPTAAVFVIAEECLR